VFQHKQAIISFFVFIFIYGLAMIPWPGLDAAYSRVYRTGSTFLSEALGTGDYVRFHPSNNIERDIKIIFFNPDQQPFKAVAISSRNSGYIYMAFIAALILATPVSWKRRGLALFWGMIAMHCFLALKMAILILYVFSHAQHSPIVFGPFWKRLLFLAHQAFLNNMVFCLIVSVFIWMAVSFRREDLNTLLLRLGINDRK
jgi:hypothetical protein